MASTKKTGRFFTSYFFVVFSAFVLVAIIDVNAALSVDNKVGIIDTARIVLQSRYAQKIRAEFTAELEEQRKALDRKREKAEKQRQKLEEAKGAGKKASVIEDLEKEFQKMVRELEWMKEDLDKDLLEMDKALLEKMRHRVRTVLDQFVATTDYCIIIEKQRVAIFCESADITEEVIRRLDSYRE